MHKYFLKQESYISIYLYITCSLLEILTFLRLNEQNSGQKKPTNNQREIFSATWLIPSRDEKQLSHTVFVRNLCVRSKAKISLYRETARNCKQTIKEFNLFKRSFQADERIHAGQSLNGGERVVTQDTRCVYVVKTGPKRKGRKEKGRKKKKKEKEKGQDAKTVAGATLQPYHQLGEGSYLNLRWLSCFSIFLGTPGRTRNARQQVIRFALLVYKMHSETFQVSHNREYVPFEPMIQKRTVPCDLANVPFQQRILSCTWSIDSLKSKGSFVRMLRLYHRNERPHYT